MVTFVSSLVAIYASGYMHGDRGYWRFFAYIGLFVFSMTMLVSVSNFVLLFVFWEAVGVCSYLLIGFWYQKPEAAAAGKKAFLVNRVGDFGFAMALFLIWSTYGTLNFHDSLADGTTSQRSRRLAAASPIEPADPRRARPIAHSQPTTTSPARMATAICLLLLLGACGKSAQFPLHVWLPDAMEGPTPVSALIHAATMVTAGVYMVARCTPLFAVSPDGAARRRRHRRLHGAAGRPDRADADRPEARAGLFDGQPARLHVPGPRRRHVRRHHRRHVPPVHARLLQGPAVPRRRQRDARDGRRDRHAAVRRPAAADAHHALRRSSSAAWPWPACFRSPASGARTRSWLRSTTRSTPSSTSSSIAHGRTHAHRSRSRRPAGILERQPSSHAAGRSISGSTTARSSPRS